MRAKIRKFENNDLPQIQTICDKHSFIMPDRNHIITEAVIEKDGIIGYGQVKLITEAIMIVDPNLSVRDRIESLELLHRQAVAGTALARFDQLHGFITDPNFSKIMMRHFGYVPCIGQALVLNL